MIYRAVAKALLDAGADLTDEALAVAAALELDPEKFGNPALKSQAVGEAASVVSAIPQVREVLVDFQRHFAAGPPGAVLDGRDIGTVICPDADVKIFVVADPGSGPAAAPWKRGPGARTPTRPRCWRISSDATSATRTGPRAPLKPARMLTCSITRSWI